MPRWFIGVFLMGDLTKNISRYELECKCGNCEVTILDDEPVINIVQKACDHFADVNGADRGILEITSGARCYVYNRAIGSTDNSPHPRARAIDFKIFVQGGQIDPKIIYGYLNLKYPDSLGLGGYASFTHVDTRPNKARWHEF